MKFYTETDDGMLFYVSIETVCTDFLVVVRAALQNRSYSWTFAAGHCGRRERKTFNDYLLLNAENAITGSHSLTHSIWLFVHLHASTPTLSYIVSKSCFVATFLYLVVCSLCSFCCFFVLICSRIMYTNRIKIWTKEFHRSALDTKLDHCQALKQFVCLFILAISIVFCIRLIQFWIRRDVLGHFFKHK